MFLNNSYQNKTNIDKTFNSSSKKKFSFKLYIILGVILTIIILLAFFLYKLSFKTEYYLVLNGDVDLVIKQNSIYEEAGFQAYDNHQNDYSDKVTISGEVNPNIAGEYTITYTFNNLIRTRSVLVVADDSQITYLILNGSSTMFLKVGETYHEPGFTVIDNLETDLTNKVTVNGSVNTSIAGTYKLVYSVTNKSGQTITEERTVIVTNSNVNLSYSPTGITNKSVTIKVNVKDNYFNYLVLPNNKQVTSRQTTYQVTKNGTYKFIIHSKDGTTKEQSITIDNIDQESPTGTCNVTRKNGMYLINVNATDNKKVKDYSYYINNSLVKTHSLNYLNHTSDVTDNIYVIVNDYANNTKKITCNIQKKQDLEIHFIDVGREDAILIRSNEATIFLDGGLYHQKDVILPYLKALGIKKFDAIIGSHMHDNHIQAQGAIIDNYPVGKVYYPVDLYTCNPKYCKSSAQEYVLDAIKRHNIPQIIMKVGDHIELGDIIIDCYSPVYIREKDGVNYGENTNSLNFILTYGKNKFMFTGDSMQSSNILKKFDKSLLDVDLLKYPHHGQSKIGDDIIYAMSPEYVVVTHNSLSSLRANKEYSYLNKIGSKIYYSGKHDNILVKSNGKNITITPNFTP